MSVSSLALQPAEIVKISRIDSCLDTQPSTTKQLVTCGIVPIKSPFQCLQSRLPTPFELELHRNLPNRTKPLRSS